MRSAKPGAPRAAVRLLELPHAPEPVAALEALRPAGHAWLLESALADGRLGRFSFAGADPWLVARARGARLELECRRAAHPGLAPGRSVAVGDPLEALRALLPSVVDAELPLPFVGGAVGWLGYELASAFEPRLAAPRDPEGPPELALLFVDRLVAWDHAGRRAFAVGLGIGDGEAAALRRADEAAHALRASLAAPAGARARDAARGVASQRPPAAVFDRGRWVRTVETILGEIAAGNVYQACLTNRLALDFAGDPWELYLALRRESPAPFAAYLELPELALAGSSPERFLRVLPDGRAESRPIKGTRPRGADPESDAALRRALAESPKDRAENLMIVDLVRNDLGRVCANGSVGVPELMAVEAYATLFQLVSTVHGRLAPGRDAFDLVRAAFPAGSMTGAPKLAAMRLLARLEAGARGPYAGALGYLDARGGLDLAVVIRSVLVRERRACLQVGAGIVADSDPLDEWRESLDKARAPLAALAAAGAPDAARLLAALEREGAPPAPLAASAQATCPPSIAKAAPLT